MGTIICERPVFDKQHSDLAQAWNVSEERHEIEWQLQMRLKTQPNTDGMHVVHCAVTCTYGHAFSISVIIA